MNFPIRTYAGGVETRVERAVRGLCQSRKTAKGLDGARISLKGDIVDKLVQSMIYAASHAAIGPIYNRIRGRGVPPDNARIILADDIVRACKEFGISSGLRFAPPESFAVDLYIAVAPTVWPTGRKTQLSPRKTFERMRRSRITRN